MARKIVFIAALAALVGAIGCSGGASTDSSTSTTTQKGQTPPGVTAPANGGAGAQTQQPGK